MFQNIEIPVIFEIFIFMSVFFLYALCESHAELPFLSNVSF